MLVLLLVYTYIYVCWGWVLRVSAWNGRLFTRLRDGHTDIRQQKVVPTISFIINSPKLPPLIDFYSKYIRVYTKVPKILSKKYLNTIKTHIGSVVFDFFALFLICIANIYHVQKLSPKYIYLYIYIYVYKTSGERKWKALYIVRTCIFENYWTPELRLSVLYVFC